MSYRFETGLHDSAIESFLQRVVLDSRWLNQWGSGGVS